MSGTRRQRDSVAPSLFPFLAVLLCTMGALVVILMLVVSGAQASAKQSADESRERAEEIESQYEMAKSSYERQLSEGRIELEKKRLNLQHFEEHILELLTELKELEKTAELIKDETTTSEEQLVEHGNAISELEKQLAEASEKLKQKSIKKPEGDKPIFAIIPYEGRNGTHRRPIYLECVADGILIQPEGVLLTIEDLQPPHGPGNPLDAALRTIRAEYSPDNGAVTRTAYPLLVVRPSGIETYALARGAMSGWDDQFGYELIDEELELAFPEGELGLNEKITKSINLARDRQAALVMAMPRKYRQFADDLRPTGSGGSGGTDSKDFADYGGGYAGPPGGQATGGNSGGRGGFELGLPYENESTGQTGSEPYGQSSSSTSMQGFAQGSSQNSPAGTAPESLRGGSGDSSQLAGYPPGSLAPGQTPSSDNLFRTSQTPSANRFFGQGLVSGENSPANSGDSSAGSPNDTAQLSDTNSSRGSSTQNSSGTAGGGQANAGQTANASGNQVAMPFGTPQSSPSGGASQSSSSASSAGGSAGGTPASDASADPNVDPSQAGMPQLSINRDLSQKRSESTQPVARRQGRNWAWSQGPPTQTSVVRSIHLHCFSDRWVLLPDDGNPEKGVVIPFDGSPQSRAEKLARAVHKQVDNWGIALAGGYWKPILVVDVAPDAMWRFDQLTQLLDGSGLEVNLRQRPQ